ncbi:MAG: hypothetical protein IK139_06935 [Lachnospiraceae bacterium]|nr:hypothetical protein [Lachnospiraceae bacterium]
MEEQTAAVVKGNNENDSNGTVKVTEAMLPPGDTAPVTADSVNNGNNVNNENNENGSNGGVNMAEQVNKNEVSNADLEKIQEMLKKIEKSNRKQVGWARTAALFMILLFVVIGGALFIMVPKIMDTLAYIDVAVDSANEVLQEADAAISDINAMSRSLTTTSDELSAMLSENSEALASAIAQIEAIDFESLNNAIVDLETTVGPLANFMGRFSKK